MMMISREESRQFNRENNGDFFNPQDLAYRPKRKELPALKGPTLSKKLSMGLKLLR